MAERFESEVRVSRDFDVIVIGAGAAGLSAAVAAADSGATVLLIDADTQVGGSSRLSGGHFYAADTSLQAECGVDDSADAMFEHYMTLNQWLVQPGVVRRYCDLSGPTFEWLRSFGVRFPREGLYPSGVGSTPRGHQPEGAGEAVVQALDAACAERGVDLLLNARVDTLLQEDGRVCGVQVNGDRARAGAVVVATGGFGANDALLDQHYPAASRGGEWRWYIGSPHAQGDGLRLGAEAGAGIDGHNRGLLLVTPGFSRDLEVLLPPWLILVNQRGARFANEQAPYTVLAGLLDHQGGPVHAVFDEAARRQAARAPGSQAYWVDDVLERKAEEGRIVRADSLAELALAMGVPADALDGTVARYNQGCAEGEDHDFLKPMARAMKIVEPPFYAVEVRPNVVCWTGTGLRIDPDAQVLSEQHRVVAGLFAAGETVGSLHGDRYIGGGGSFGPCIVFGKLAGENAARFAMGQND